MIFNDYYIITKYEQAKEDNSIRRSKGKQDVIIIGAIIKSPKRTRPSLGVGMTHMGQTLQMIRFNT